jgi:hypothetical protein
MSLPTRWCMQTIFFNNFFLYLFNYQVIPKW